MIALVLVLLFAALLCLLFGSTKWFRVVGVVLLIFVLFCLYPLLVATLFALTVFGGVAVYFTRNSNRNSTRHLKRRTFHAIPKLPDRRD